MALALVSIVLVGVKYWLWERGLHVDPVTHLPVQMPTAGAAYVAALDFVYTPMRAAIGWLASAAPVGGIAVDAIVDVVAVAQQNALVVSAYAFLRGRQASGRLAR